MSYTTYLFDFDYTLADSSRGIVTCFRNVLNHHGYTDPTDDDIKRTIGKTLEESFSILTGVTDEQQLAAFKKEYGKEADTHMTINTRLFPETQAVLTALKDAGARIGIISTKFRFRIKELLDLHFPADFLDIIVGGEDVKTHKPSPEGLLSAIEQLHADKAETLYIGDSIVDAETALAAGVDFAGVTHGMTTTEELSQYPHWKIMSTLEELLVQEEAPKSEELPEHEEAPSDISEIEAPILPTTEGSIRRIRKKISIWQILVLLFLLWLAYEEQSSGISLVFPLIFILTFWDILQKRSVLPEKAERYLAARLHFCTVRLRAIHIKLIRGRETPPLKDETNVCRNCGHTYTGNFCNRCGQSRNTPRYRLNNALRNIAGGFFNIDNGFGRTLIDLLHRPGYMIRDFIGGKRIPYFRPFQTLFILAAIYIMTVQLVDPDALKPKAPLTEQQETMRELTREQKRVQKRLDKAKTAEERKVLEITLKSLEKKLTSQQVLQAVTDSLAAGNLAKTSADGEDDLVEAFVSDSQRIKNKIEQYLRHSPFLMNVWNLLKTWGHGNKAFSIIATLPLFAIATQLAFRRRKYKLNYNLTEHIFIQAYIACQILLLSILAVPLNGHARTEHLYELPILLIFALFCWDYKQLYRCTWWKSFWRTLLMFTYSLIVLVLLATLVMLLMGLAVYALKPFIN